MKLSRKVGRTGFARAALIALALATMVVAGLGTPAGAAQGVVNVNTATPDELVLLPGIGDAKARAIVQHRKQHGAYRHVDDLLAVKGIGDAALDKIRTRVVLEGKTTLRE